MNRQPPTQEPPQPGTSAQSRRQRQAAERRRHLLRVALRLFAEQGYAGTSTKEIARVAGVADGLVFHYFASKEQILTAVMAEHSLLPAVTEILSGLSGKRTAQGLLEAIRALTRLFQDRQAILRVYLREGPVVPAVAEALQKLLADAGHMLAAYLEERVRDGEVRVHQAQVVARLLLLSLMADAWVGNRRMSQDVYATQLVELLTLGISRR